MAILDLQKMQGPSDQRAGKSAASKRCSGASLLLC
jgi:hypothetical protein